MPSRQEVVTVSDDFNPAEDEELARAIAEEIWESADPSSFLRTGMTRDEALAWMTKETQLGILQDVEARVIAQHFFEKGRAEALATLDKEGRDG